MARFKGKNKSNSAWEFEAVIRGYERYRLSDKRIKKTANNGVNMLDIMTVRANLNIWKANMPTEQKPNQRRTK